MAIKLNKIIQLNQRDPITERDNPTRSFITKWNELVQAVKGVQSGVVNSIIAGVGLAGGGKLSDGNVTVGLADTAVAPGTYGGASTIPEFTVDQQGRLTDADERTLSDIIDAAIGSTRGAILYRGVSGWAHLAPGDVGKFLQTQGAGADPNWATQGGGSFVDLSDTPPNYSGSNEKYARVSSRWTPTTAGGINPANYTQVDGADPGTVTLATDEDRLHIAMSNSVGAGKVLFKPSSSAGAADAGALDVTGDSDVGVAFIIDDHSGWDGTAAWLGVGLGIVDASDGLSSMQLQSRNSATEEYGHRLSRASGFTTTSSSGWSSSSGAWGEDAISPKTTPIYVGIFLDVSAETFSIYRGDPSGSGSWTLIHSASTLTLSDNDEFGLLLYALTGTQSFDVYLSAVEWGWDGSSWPFTAEEEIVFDDAAARAYTVASLPSTTPAGQIIYVSDEAGGATLAFSDGADWRRVQDRAVVS